MKQHFNTTPGTGVFLSLEEEAIILNDIGESTGAADLAITNADRIVDIQKGMDDVGLIMAATPDENTVEQELARYVADMAVAGTDADPVVLMPDVSAPLDGTEVATEDNGSLVRVGGQAQADSNGAHQDTGFVRRAIEQLAALWSHIKQLLQEAWKHTQAALSNVFGLMENAQRKIKDLLAEYSALGSVQPKDNRNIVIYDMGDTFRVGGKMLLGDERLSAIEKLNAFVRSLYGIGPKKVINIGRHIEQALHNFDPNNTDDFAKNFAHELSELFMDYAKTFTATYMTDPHGGDANTVLTSTPLLGNFQAVVRIPAALANEEATDPDEILVYASKIRADISKQDTHTKDSHVGLTYPVQESSYYMHSLAGAAGLVHLVLDYKRGNTATQLAGQASAIERATAGAIDKAKRSSNTEAISIVKKVLPINNAYANWSSQPMMKTISQLARVINAEIRMAEMALKRF